MHEEQRDSLGRRKGRIRKVYSLETLLDRSEPEPNTGCWLWTGPVAGGTGYGVVNHDGAPVGAHRLAFTLAHGAISSGNDVCHRCDVRTCINPAHLFQGSRAVNLADMRAKGRQADMRGERHPKAKITEAQVREIRAAVASGETMRSVGSRYGLTSMTVADIHHRRSWKHIT